MFKYPFQSLTVNESSRKYVNQVLDSNQLTQGEMVERFENELGRLYRSNAIACNSGTSALHLALIALRVREGDEVIVPALSFVATANAVVYCGANVVFADVDPVTWCISPKEVAKKITGKTKAIIVTSLYGHPIDFAPLRKVAGDIPIIEDAAQRFGPRKLQANLTCFSFHGSKLITTGEGGAVLTDELLYIHTMEYYRGQCFDKNISHYYHGGIGYNYRMAEMNAAMGLGQLDDLNWKVTQKYNLRNNYEKLLPDRVTLQNPGKGNIHWWAFAVQLPINYHCIGEILNEYGIETRPIFFPLPYLDPYELDDYDNDFSVASKIHENGLVLPSSENLQYGDVEYICQVLGNLIGEEHD